MGNGNEKNVKYNLKIKNYALENASTRKESTRLAWFINFDSLFYLVPVCILFASRNNLDCK